MINDTIVVNKLFETQLNNSANGQQLIDEQKQSIVVTFAVNKKFLAQIENLTSVATID